MSSGNPNHPRSSEQNHIIEALQYYNSLYNKLHQSKSAKVLHIIIYKPFVPNLTNLKFSYYNHSSGVALVTLLQITKTHCSAQKPNLLLIVACRRHTCNKGLTNPEYKGIPQDLTDEKGGEDLGMQAQGNQGEDVARIKVLLYKSY
jgi:hypothetical protein